MTNMISAEGRRRLQERYDVLWEKERPHMVKNMAEAAAEGDRSENAQDYITGGHCAVSE